MLEAKIVKQGENKNGPWTLYAIRFDSGKEATTFSRSLYDGARRAKEGGYAVEATLQRTPRGTYELVELTSVDDVA